MNRSMTQNAGSMDALGEIANAYKVLENGFSQGTLSGNTGKGDVGKGKIIRNEREDANDEKIVLDRRKRQEHWDMSWEPKQLEKVKGKYSTENYRERMQKHLKGVLSAKKIS